MIDFMKKIIESHSGVSSKRLCGVLGWIVTIGVLCYCTACGIQAPGMIETFMICSSSLLGIDSVTGIWKKVNSQINHDTP